MNTKFNVYIYFFLFPLLYYNYSFIYLYKGYASYIHISRRYVKHKRLKTTVISDIRHFRFFISLFTDFSRNVSFDILRILTWLFLSRLSNPLFCDPDTSMLSDALVSLLRKDILDNLTICTSYIATSICALLQSYQILLNGILIMSFIYLIINFSLDWIINFFLMPPFLIAFEKSSMTLF
jgi:hypothetical protein